MTLPPPSFSRLPSGLLVREFRLSDQEGCLDIYRSNQAEFLPDEIELFIQHLEEPFSYFLVVESPDGILACGGIDLEGESNTAGLAFGMVRRDLHRRGLGSLLTLTRLALLDGEHDLAVIGLETTVAMEGFYRGLGFVRVTHPEQRYVGGSYYVSMQMPLSIEERDAVRQCLRQLPVKYEIGGFDSA